VQLFTGKGGVGKTTVVGALAVRAAELGHRPLIVELGHRASMATLFGVPEIAYAPTAVGHGVHAMNVDLEEAIADYITAQVKVRAVARAAMRSTTLKRFFHAAPAVAEVATLHKLRLLAEAERGGEPRWYPILVDLDATGHALMFLELPRVFEGIAREGPLRTLLDGFSALLRDAPTTALHLVTVPGELPVHETLELYDSLHHDPRVALGGLGVNMVPPPVLSAEEVALLGELEARADLSLATRADLALARRRHEARERALGRVEVLRRAIDLPLTTLGWSPTEAGGIASLQALGASLLGGKAP